MLNSFMPLVFAHRTSLPVIRPVHFQYSLFAYLFTPKTLKTCLKLRETTLKRRENVLWCWNFSNLLNTSCLWVMEKFRSGGRFYDKLGGKREKHGKPSADQKKPSAAPILICRTKIYVFYNLCIFMVKTEFSTKLEHVFEFQILTGFSRRLASINSVTLPPLFFRPYTHRIHHARK